MKRGTLVFFPSGTASDIESALSGNAVVQQFGPRLFVLRDDPVGTELGPYALRDMNDVDRLRSQMDQLERLSAEAWFTEKDEEARKGEGLPWDHPDYEPP